MSRRERAVRRDAGRFLWARSLESVGDGLAIRHKTNSQKKKWAFGQKSKRPLSGLGVREWMKRLQGGDVTLWAWTGYQRALQAHCTGGITSQRSNDWTQN